MEDSVLLEEDLGFSEEDLGFSEEDLGFLEECIVCNVSLGLFSFARNSVEIYLGFGLIIDLGFSFIS